MSGWTTDLIAGMAALLADVGVGTYRPTGAYLPGEVAISDRYIPPDGQCITLSAYPAGPDLPGLADVTVGVQVRVRGDEDPVTCDDLADAAYAVLHGAQALVFGAVAVVQIRRQSYTSLGPDANGRWERSENYFVDAMRPNANNPD